MDQRRAPLIEVRASKGMLVERVRGESRVLGPDFELVSPLPELLAQRPRKLAIKLRNIGLTVWSAGQGFAYTWRPHSPQPFAGTVALSEDVRAGGEATLGVDVPAGIPSGRWWLRLELVGRNAKAIGSRPLEVPVRFLARERYAAGSISIVSAPSSVLAGGALALVAHVVNRGEATWSANAPGPVLVLCRIEGICAGSDPEVVDRFFLPHDVPPGGEAAVPILLHLSAEPGRKRLRIVLTHPDILSFGAAAYFQPAELHIEAMQPGDADEPAADPAVAAELLRSIGHVRQ